MFNLSSCQCMPAKNKSFLWHTQDEERSALESSDGFINNGAHSKAKESDRKDVWEGNLKNFINPSFHFFPLKDNSIVCFYPIKQDSIELLTLTEREAAISLCRRLPAECHQQLKILSQVERWRFLANFTGKGQTLDFWDLKIELY